MDVGDAAWSTRRESWRAQPEDARDEAAVDYARVIHSASFRRLQGKTQILNLGDGDFYRNRLTHSIEVAQIAGGIARQLQKDNAGHAAAPWIPDLTMIQAIGATHDLGHPPFGHGGEVALNYCMRKDGGFEGNGQTLRIVARLEQFSDSAGSNLTRRTLLGLLKYPVAYSAVANPERQPRLADATSVIDLIDREQSKPPKCYLDTEQDVVEWMLDPVPSEDRQRFTSWDKVAGKHGRTRHKSFDCTIMDLADDISFGVHDLEDALALRLMGEGDLRSLIPEEECTGFLDALKERYPHEFGNQVYEGLVAALVGDGNRRKRFVNRMIHHFVTHCRIEVDDAFETPLLRYRAALPAPQSRFLSALKDAVAKRVIRSAEVQQLEFKGQNMVVAVFEALSSDPNALLPEKTRERYHASRNPPRVICDHIAGMTDTFLLKTYERLFSPRMGSVFDRL